MSISAAKVESIQPQEQFRQISRKSSQPLHDPRSDNSGANCQNLGDRNRYSFQGTSEGNLRVGYKVDIKPFLDARL